MAKESDEEVIASVQQVNAHMDGLQAEAERKRKAFIKAQEKMESAKTELEEADKAVTAYQPEHKEAGRKLMTIMSKDPSKLQQLLTAGLKAAAPTA